MQGARELVEAFYLEVWNQADEDLARRLLAEDFRFRGSLGAERVGPEGFIAYMRDVHRALGHYRCIIDDLLVEGDCAAARMRFTGRHRDYFQGVAATLNGFGQGRIGEGRVQKHNVRRVLAGYLHSFLGSRRNPR